MWDFLSANQFLVGALTGSVAAFFLSLIHGHLKRERKLISYSITSRSVAEKGSGDLEVTYRGQKILRLDSHSIVFTNSGNRALTSFPLIVDFGEGAQAVDIEIKGPAGVKFLARLDGTEVATNVDLLNCGEAVTFGLNVIDGNLDRISVAARAENLKLITGDAEKSASTQRAKIHDLIFMVMILLVLLGAIGMYDDFRSIMSELLPPKEEKLTHPAEK